MRVSQVGDLFSLPDRVKNSPIYSRYWELNIHRFQTLIELTSNSIQTPNLFLYTWKSEGSWRDFGSVGRDFFGFVFFLFSCDVSSFAGSVCRVLQTLLLWHDFSCVFFLINIFVFYWWAALAHREVAQAHKQKFYNTRGHIEKGIARSHQWKV